MNADDSPILTDDLETLRQSALRTASITELAEANQERRQEANRADVLMYFLEGDDVQQFSLEDFNYLQGGKPAKLPTGKTLERIPDVYLDDEGKPVVSKTAREWLKQNFPAAHALIEYVEKAKAKVAASSLQSIKENESDLQSNQQVGSGASPDELAGSRVVEEHPVSPVSSGTSLNSHNARPSDVVRQAGEQRSRELMEQGVPKAETIAKVAKWIARITADELDKYESAWCEIEIGKTETANCAMEVNAKTGVLRIDLEELEKQAVKTGTGRGVKEFIEKAVFQEYGLRPQSSLQQESPHEASKRPYYLMRTLVIAAAIAAILALAWKMLWPSSVVKQQKAPPIAQSTPKPIPKRFRLNEWCKNEHPQAISFVQWLEDQENMWTAKRQEEATQHSGNEFFIETPITAADVVHRIKDDTYHILMWDTDISCSKSQAEELMSCDRNAKHELLFSCVFAIDDLMVKRLYSFDVSDETDEDGKTKETGFMHDDVQKIYKCRLLSMHTEPKPALKPAK